MASVRSRKTRSRSRPGSRASSRPGSRPGSMALSLSANVSQLGSKLITKITGIPDPDDVVGTSETEENFNICHDFFTSNMLYHTFLDPREKPIQEKFKGLQTKWVIQAKPRKAQRLAALLENFNSAPVFNPDVDHEQHDIRLRLLSLLVHLSNADTQANDDYQGEMAVGAESSLDTPSKILAGVQAAAQEETEELRRILAEGETEFKFPEEDSDLSDWGGDTSEEDSKVDDAEVRLQEALGNVQGRRSQPQPTFPGIQPPKKVPPVGREVSHSPNSSRAWLTSNTLPQNEIELVARPTLPQYWLKEKDAHTNLFPVEVKEEEDGGSRNLVAQVDQFYAKEVGLPITQKVVLSEYQVLREVIFSFLAPCFCVDKMPLFDFDRSSRKFLPNRDVCIPSLMPQSLQSYMGDLCQALTAKRELDEFIDFVLSQDSRQAMTLEAYAEALANVIRLFSAHLTAIEATVTSRSETFTMMDFFNQTSHWFTLLGKLASFHRQAILTYEVSNLDYNWQASILLLANLNHAIDTEVSPEMYAIYVDLYLKSLAPYFNIASIWVSHGRLEDPRNEFVHAVTEETYHHQAATAVGNDALKAASTEDLSLQETFWTHGFVTRPYEELVSSRHGLPVPKMFQRFFPRVLNCGKSIEVLTMLQKQGRFPSSRFMHYTEVTEIHSEFVKNLKAHLGTPRLDQDQLDQDDGFYEPPPSVETKKPKYNEFFQAIYSGGAGLNDGDESDVDPCLVEAFNHVLAVSNREVQRQETKAANDTRPPQTSDSSFALAGHSLDPLRPVGSLFETCLVPIVSDHVDAASNQLLVMFVETLCLERHLAAARRTFLMEAGDLMTNFCDRLFQQIAAARITSGSQQQVNSSIDSVGLTMALHDCFSSADPGDIIFDKFHVNVQPNPDNNGEEFDLSQVGLHYEAEWPLSIVMNGKCMGGYQAVFGLTLRVRQALWCLQNITAKQISRSATNCQQFVQDLDKNNEMFLIRQSSHGGSEWREDDDFESEFGSNVQATKIHRVLLLRCWLLHFVNSVQSYLMTRVLHARTREFLTEIEENKVGGDLDGIIGCHDSFVTALTERCFLTPKEKVLKKSVVKVLDLCVSLHSATHKFCQAFDDTDSSEFRSGPTSFECDEEERKSARVSALTSTSGELMVTDKDLDRMEDSYRKCHAFLATTLRSITQNRNVPHLEALAADLNQTLPVPQRKTTTYV